MAETGQHLQCVPGRGRDLLVNAAVMSGHLGKFLKRLTHRLDGEPDLVGLEIETAIGASDHQAMTKHIIVSTVRVGGSSPRDM